MARTFKVAPNCCILPPEGAGSKDLISSGTVITDADLPSQLIQEHLRSGFLLPVNAPEIPDAIPGVVSIKPPSIETIIGKDSRPLVISGQSGNGKDARALQITEDEAAAKKKAADEAAASGNKGPDLSPWVLDPEELAKNDDLTALNVMILERDPDAKPLETIEEARAFLSQDFRK